jgi:ribosomal protein L40E
MPQEVVGYTNTVWTCPACGTKNPGPRKTCSGCGAAQPDDVQFEKAASETLLTNASDIAQAQKGADVHCPYCGTRNPSDAVTCSQCGGNLAGGEKRAAGKILGNFNSAPAAPINCPSCGAANPPDAAHCSSCGAPLRQPPTAPPPPAKKSKGGKLWLILAGIIVLIGVAITVISCWPRNIAGEVNRVSWERVIPIEEIQPVKKEDWKNNVPSGAANVSCDMKEYNVQDNPAPNATKECGQPYSKDLGNGRAEVVQDCKYHVYADYCSYTVKEWVTVDTARAQGANYSPYWPNFNLKSGQREGQRQEIYTVVFASGGKEYTYTTSDGNLYNQCQLNSGWQLRVSGKRVLSISPGQ